MNQRSPARELAAVALFKTVVSALVLGAGFRAVSDDDFARVVIAQTWAHTPRLDPSGTSWLPLPFWLNGGAMLVFGRSLLTARVLAFVLGVASALLVLLAARWMLGEEDDDRAPVLAGALAASAIPWSARLGVATVPELPTAALMLLGMASLVPHGAGTLSAAARSRRRLAGAGALFAACVSRYEAWPLAAGFAAFCLRDAWLARDARAMAGAAGRAGGTRTGAGPVAAASLALVGPAAWMAWNAVAHGHALHFAGRVAAYHGAITGGAPGLAKAAGAYLNATVRAEPELCVLAATTTLVAALTEIAPRKELQRDLVNAARPAALAALLFGSLTLAGARSGAPTHHPERALLSALLLLALLTGAALVRLGRAAHSAGRAWIPLGMMGAALAAGAFIRWRAPEESYLAREEEVAIGRAAGALLPPGDRLLIEVVDYGHLAVIAAMGRPEDVVVDRSVDPREAVRPSSFDDEAAIRARIAEAGTQATAARRSTIMDAFGRPIVESGAWGLWRVDRDR